MLNISTAKTATAKTEAETALSPEAAEALAALRALDPAEAEAVIDAYGTDPEPAAETPAQLAAKIRI